MRFRVWGLGSDFAHGLQACTSAGNTALHMAVLHGQREIVDWLIQEGKRVIDYDHGSNKRQDRENERAQLIGPISEF